MVMLTLMVMMMMVDGDDGDDHEKRPRLDIVQPEPPVSTTCVTLVGGT